MTTTAASTPYSFRDLEYKFNECRVWSPGGGFPHAWVRSDGSTQISASGTRIEDYCALAARAMGYAGDAPQSYWVRHVAAQQGVKTSKFTSTNADTGTHHALVIKDLSEASAHVCRLLMVQEGDKAATPISHNTADTVVKSDKRVMIDSKTLADIAPTLADVKKLPMEQKCRLLLARLAKIGEHDSALNKHNLMMPGDPYALAHGYPDAQKTPVREHLLGAPWTRLVNEGYLADFTGQGFFKVTEEGKEYLAKEELPLQSFSTSVGPPKSTTGAPRAFLSYSWEDSEHQQWVTKFAERLHGDNGVEIIFDGWHLKPGDDKLHFMEQAVTKSNFVVVVCTPTYAERANDRKGGVGYESMVITAELAEHILTNKFIPVLRKGTWVSSLPIYLKSRMGVNLSDKPYDENEYEKLLRVLHGETIQPPPLGKKPDFTKKTGWSSKTASVLGQPNTRPNAIAWASYEKPGASAPRESAYARLWNIEGKEQYSFETTRGEEYLGSKDEVINRFLSFHQFLLKEGYKRMNFTPGPDPDFSVLG